MFQDIDPCFQPLYQSELANAHVDGVCYQVNNEEPKFRIEETAYLIFFKKNCKTRVTVKYKVTVWH